MSALTRNSSPTWQGPLSAKSAMYRPMSTFAYDHCTSSKPDHDCDKSRHIRLTDRYYQPSIHFAESVNDHAATSAYGSIAAGFPIDIGRRSRNDAGRVWSRIAL